MLATRSTSPPSWSRSIAIQKGRSSDTYLVVDCATWTLQGLTNALCFGYQIVCLPISLPVPVFMADEGGKRGKNNYAAHVMDDGSDSALSSISQEDFGLLSRQLSYAGTSLSNVRVNA